MANKCRMTSCTTSKVGGRERILRKSHESQTTRRALDLWLPSSAYSPRSSNHPELVNGKVEISSQTIHNYFPEVQTPSHPVFFTECEEGDLAA